MKTKFFNKAMFLLMVCVCAVLLTSCGNKDGNTSSGQTETTRSSTQQEQKSESDKKDETKEDMEQSVRYVCKKSTWGIKLHMLNVVKGSRMAVKMPDYVPFDSMDDYIGLVCDLIEIIPPEVTIHRLTADAPRKTLIAPEWSYMKRSILNGIHAELRRRGTRQGSRL